MTSLVEIERGQVVERRYEFAMIRTERLFDQRQRSFVEWLGLAVAALHPVELAEIVQRDGEAGMIGAERPFANRQQALRERNRLGISSRPVKLRHSFVEL